MVLFSRTAHNYISVDSWLISLSFSRLLNTTTINHLFSFIFLPQYEEAPAFTPSIDQEHYSVLPFISEQGSTWLLSPTYEITICFYIDDFYQSHLKVIC